MKNYAARNEKINIGKFVFTKRRYSIVVSFFSKRNYRFPNFAEEIDFNTQQRLEKIIVENEEELLWIYEGRYLYERCLKLLSLRPRSLKEIETFLVLHSDNSITVDIIIKKLDPLLNDRLFAEFFIQKERNNSPKGDKIIRYKLLAKGVEAGIIDELIAADQTNVREYIARQYEKKKNWILNNLKREKNINIEKEFRIKMTNYLYSKGFSYSDINNFLSDQNGEI